MGSIPNPPHNHSSHSHAHTGDSTHQESFIWKYIFSTDHKVIGIQYMFMSLFFLLFGFGLVMLMRWQLAYPGQSMPFIGKLFGENNMPGGVMLPEF